MPWRVCGLSLKEEVERDGREHGERRRQRNTSFTFVASFSTVVNRGSTLGAKYCVSCVTTSLSQCRISAVVRFCNVVARCSPKSTD